MANVSQGVPALCPSEVCLTFLDSDPDDSQETPNEAGEGPELKELRSAVQRQSNKNEQVQGHYLLSSEGPNITELIFRQPVVSDAAHICPKYLVLLAMSL